MDTIPTLPTTYAPAAGDPDAVSIGALYRRGCQSMVDSVVHLLEVGQRLLEKKVSLGHGNWLPWFEAHADELGFTSRTAQKLIDAGIKYGAGVVFTHQKAIEISRSIWGHNLRGAGGTGNDEWRTPGKYFPLIRAVLGDIDCDPASTEHANNKTVKARTYFDKEQDGRLQPWYGRVWLNPPYSEPLIAQFISKLVAERRAGRVTAAILLTHNYTDTAWFHEALSEADAVCLTRGRVKFLDPNDKKARPTQGQAFFYFGPDVELFEQVFVFRRVGSSLHPSRGYQDSQPVGAGAINQHEAAAEPNRSEESLAPDDPGPMPSFLLRGPNGGASS